MTNWKIVKDGSNFKLFSGSTMLTLIPKTPKVDALPDLIEACTEALQGLYVEHAEICSTPDDCPYMETYRKLEAALIKAGQEVGE